MKKRLKKKTQCNIYIVKFERVPPYPQHGCKQVLGLKEAWKLADKLATMPQVKTIPTVHDWYGNRVMRNGKLI